MRDNPCRCFSSIKLGEKRAILVKTMGCINLWMSLSDHHPHRCFTGRKLGKEKSNLGQN